MVSEEDSLIRLGQSGNLEEVEVVLHTATIKSIFLSVVIIVTKWNTILF